VELVLYVRTFLSWQVVYFVKQLTSENYV
jgi:hypothetical protein